MNYIKGKIKQIIYHNNESGYVVALFKIKETNDLELKDKTNKTITITGTFTDTNIDIVMTLYGSYNKNEKFGMQYVVKSYEIEKPTTKEAIIEFLSSSFVEGCGERTAKKIVDTYGEKTLDVIKEDINNLTAIDGITSLKAAKIYNSLINYYKSSDAIIKLQGYGFSIEECSKIYNMFKDRLDDVLGDSFYELKQIIDFDRLDSIFINNFGSESIVRIYACLLESMQRISNNIGDTFYYKEEINNVLQNSFNVFLSDEAFDDVLSELSKNLFIYIDGRRIYLNKYYEAELNIASTLKIIDSFKVMPIKEIDKKLVKLENELGINYNIDQEHAIVSSLNNNVTIISGGPGTGKTTIINAIVKLYIKENNLGPQDILESIALLAPTGRAAKKLATSTNTPAYTIHRYLKWYKDSNDFYYNEYNKTNHKLVIVDEVSMIDIDLFNALLNGIRPNVKLILVGDIFQLPSVGPGLILSDLIESDYFNFVPLNQIYRQSENSYIPYLAKEIKTNDIGEDFISKKDDYNFVITSNEQIKQALKEIVKKSLNKGIDEKRLQILAPMYRGETGIDSLNVTLQEIYNPRNHKKNEIKYGDVIYREGDKIIQLINNLDNNVFNGDIGYIDSIVNNNIIINFDGNRIEYSKKDLKEIKHAYAMTIHKSQGSEFDYVILPISNSYYKMLYNKLVYTAVSRAKKSLVIVGDPKVFIQAVNNNYSANRKTSLKDRIYEVYK